MDCSQLLHRSMYDITGYNLKILRARFPNGTRELANLTQGHRIVVGTLGMHEVSSDAVGVVLSFLLPKERVRVPTISLAQMFGAFVQPAALTYPYRASITQEPRATLHVTVNPRSNAVRRELTPIDWIESDWPSDIQLWCPFKQQEEVVRTFFDIRQHMRNWRQQMEERASNNAEREHAQAAELENQLDGYLAKVAMDMIAMNLE